jgi:DNA-binding CsgD family transcriptional regulator
MGAENPIRRSKTANELAARLGCSPRTVRNIVAEPRGEFLARTAANRARAVELRAQGLLYREIAEAMGVSTGAVGKLLHDARRERASADVQEQASV